MSLHIHVANPNSNHAVTTSMAQALQCFESPDIKIHCSTLEAGPFGIESQADTDSVAVQCAI